MRVPLPSRVSEWSTAITFLALFLPLATFFVMVLAFLWPAGHKQPPTTLHAGLVEDFAPGSIRYFQDEHFYLVREDDGSFTALYDWDARAQTRYKAGAIARDGCRVQILDRSSEAYPGDLQAIRADYPPVPGLEDVILRQGCDGSVYDPLGRRAFCPAPTDLDRFPVVADGGRVIVDFTHRRCQIESPCLPYR